MFVKYIKTYIFQFFSLILNFISMFIVLPTITNKPNLYAIYSLILSLGFIYSFADLGFARATFKEAGECFGRKDLEDELKIIGFTTFLRLILIIIITIPLFLLLINPNIIIKDYLNNDELRLFRYLIIILMFFAPINSFMLISDVIYSTRIEYYKLQRILIVFNALKIIFFLLLFSNNNYRIVEYYLAINLLNLFAYIISLYLINKEYNISLKIIYKNFKFDPILFKKLFNFSFGYFLGNIIALLYTQLDNLIISKLFGLNKVAFFSISITLFNYLNSIFWILYSPFSSKFSHYIGKQDNEGIVTLLNKLIIIFSPLFVLLIFNIILYIDCFIINWVGKDFKNSIDLTRILLLYYIIYGIQMPLGIYLVSKGLLTFANLISLINLILYFSGLIIFYKFFGIIIIPIMKVFTYYLLTISYVIYLKKLLLFDFKKIFNNLINLLIVLIVAFSLSYFIKRYIPLEKSKVNLLITILFSGFNILITYIIFLLTNKYYKNYLISIIPQNYQIWRKFI